MRQTDRFEQFSHSQRHALDASRNLVIRANAGSGKTSVLIERIVQILARSQQTSAPLAITDLAAITFTRKAAAELQNRLREAFEHEQAVSTDPAEIAFWSKASRDLSKAMIGTIDSLCGRILREFHWELPDSERIEVDYQPLDSYDQNLLEQEAINRVINRSGAAADGANSPERAVLDWWGRREGFAVLTQHLLALLRNPVEPERIVVAHSELPSIEERCRRIREDAPAVRLLTDSRQSLQDSLRGIIDLLGDKPRTKMLGKLREKSRTLLAFLPDASNDPASIEQLRDILLTAAKKPISMHGYKDVESQLVALQEAWTAALQVPLVEVDGEAHAMQAADHLACLLGPVQAEYQALCREANRYDFSTLARRTRHLLETSADACAELKRRYRYVMVDEFQDTNPLQWDILSRMVGNGPEGLLDRDRLCIVGDPQQSIFRFRQADVRVFQQVHELIVVSNRHHGLAYKPMDYDAVPNARPSTAEEREGFVALAENYRSLSPLPLALMDEVFRFTFDPDEHELDPAVDRFEIEYQRLEAGLTGQPCGEVRYVFADSSEGEEEDSDPANGNEEPKPDEELVAAQVETVADEFIRLWGAPRLLRKKDEPETLRWSDMAVLLPSRAATLTALETALRRRGIPFVVFGGIGFWQRQEIRDLVHLASWLADPGDEMALFVVLRSPLVLLSDSEIFFVSQLGSGGLWRGLHAASQARDSLSATSSEPGLSRRPETPGLSEALEQTWQQFAPERRAAIQEAAARLDRWRERTDRMGHADVLQRALEESGAYALYAVLPEGEQILANLRQFFDRVRADEGHSALGLGRLARKLRKQIDDFEKEGQANLSGGEDAVQIMTVHAAKGLEFPVVAVLKMEGSVVAPQRPSLMVEDQDHGHDAAGTVYVSVRHPKHPLRTFTCQGLRRLRELDRRQEIAEKRRLFYVAGTRASERLILAGRATKRKRISWQGWFEGALRIEEEQRRAGRWEHPQNGWQVSIVGLSSEMVQPKVEAASSTRLRVDLEPIVEESQTPLVAATQLATLLEASKANPRDWWLRHHLHLDPSPRPAGEMWDRPSGSTPRESGALIGQLVHRLLMLGDDIFGLAPEAFKQRLLALAAALLEPLPPGEDNDVAGPDPLEIEIIAGAARRIFARLSQPDPAAEAIRQLMLAPGKTEVPFALALGRWVVRGRFDKLIRSEHADGYVLVDWKTGHLHRARDAEKRYRAQMLLYALALARTGLAARIDGEIQVQLVFLETAEIRPLRFNDETLRAFGSEIEADLLKTDAFSKSLEAAGRAVPRESDGR